MKSLSLRLETIASLVPNGTRVCDIGTDHGYLSIYLKSHNIAKSVIATDLNQKPLMNAQKNILSSGVSGIELRLGSGLSPINQTEVDTIIIAGMGGEVIANILEDCSWIKNDNLTLILQPTTSADDLRRFLCNNGFEIQSETPVNENQKLYSVMVVKFTGNIKKYPEHFYYIGMLTTETEAGLLYIKKQQKILLKCINSLENIPSKQEIYAKMLGCINSPATGIAGCVSGVMSALVRAIDAVREQKAAQ